MLGPPPSPYAPPEPKPGIVPLRPLGLGEILDGAVTYVRRNPRSTLGLAAIMTSISAAVQLAVAFVAVGELANLLDPGAAPADLEELVGMFSGTITSVLIGLVVGFFIQLILTGMLTTVVGRSVLGRPTTIRDAWRDIRPRLLPLVGLSLTIGAIFLAVFAAAALPVAAIAVVGGPVALTVLLGFLLAIGAVVVAVWLWVELALATPALILERAGVFVSVRRSWALIRRSFWRAFGILLLTLVIAIVVSQILQLPFAIPQQVLVFVDPDPLGWPFKLGLVLAAVGGVVAGTVVSPFSAGVRALLYVDRRIRREGLDLALRDATSGPTRDVGGSEEHHGPSPWEMSVGADPRRGAGPTGW